MATFELADLDEQLASYRIVKACLMRGTVHLVTRRQYLAWRLALQPTLEQVVRRFCPRLWQRVDHERLIDAGHELIGDSDGLTRQEIGSGLSRQFPDAAPQDLAFAVRTLCCVVQRSADPRASTASAWIPHRTRYVLARSVVHEPMAPPDTGTEDLLRSFLRAFGPATAADATYWSGLTRLGHSLCAAADTVATTAMTAGAGRRVVPRFDVPTAGQDPRRAFVLPEFDSLYFGSVALPAELAAAKKRLLYGAALMHGSLVFDGCVVGQWQTPRDSQRPMLDVWQRLSPQATAEFERFASWYVDTSSTARPVRAFPTKNRRTPGR